MTFLRRGPARRTCERATSATPLAAGTGLARSAFTIHDCMNATFYRSGANRHQMGRMSAEKLWSPPDEGRPDRRLKTHAMPVSIEVGRPGPGARQRTLSRTPQG